MKIKKTAHVKIHAVMSDNMMIDGLITRHLGKNPSNDIQNEMTYPLKNIRDLD